MSALQFINGVLPVDPDNARTPLPEMVEEQTRKIFANLERELGRAGLDRRSVVAVYVHMRDLKRLYERMDAAYSEFFSGQGAPTRSCIGVAELPRGALVQMDFVIRAASGNPAAPR
jgi:2-iminobutanoate/2-iminopropanoate deaminase